MFIYKKTIKMLVIVLVVLTFTGTSNTKYVANALDMQSGEYLLKAAFIYNIAKFVQWPSGSFENEKSPLVLCVLGKDPFGNALSSIEGKRIQDRVLVVKRIEKIEDLETCQILFISSSEINRLNHILQYLKDMKVLTIGEVPFFARNGGMINLLTFENKIYIEININKAERANLQISSKLLKLARIVNDEKASVQ